MHFDITIRNYRCFPSESPIQMSLKPGFTALVGKNNSGKSSVLKCFFEFRNLFIAMKGPGNIAAILRGGGHGIGGIQQVFDSQEVFNNTNERELAFEFRQVPDDGSEGACFRLSFQRKEPTTVRGEVVFPQFTKSEVNVDQSRGIIQRGTGDLIFSFAPVIELFDNLSRMQYLGASRNLINQGSNQSYYDMQAGQAFIQSWKSLKAGTNHSTNEASLQLIEDIGEIFRFDKLSIDSSSDD